MAQFTSFANLKEQREANKKKFCDVSINMICKQLNCTWYDLYIYLYNDEALFESRETCQMEKLNKKEWKEIRQENIQF